MSVWARKQSWSVLLLSIMATLIAVLGQNSFIGVFTVDFLQTLQLSFTQFGFIMMAATLLASLLVPRTGRLLDSMGAMRTTLIIVCGGIGTLLLFAVTPWMAETLSPAFAVILLGLTLTGFRLCFRGSFRMISSSLVTLSFAEKDRGKAFAIVGVLSGLVGSSIPYLAYQLHEALDFFKLSMVLIAGLVAYAAIFMSLRQHVKAGASQGKDQDVTEQADASIAPEEARQRLSFWLYMIGVPFYSLLLSSVILFLDPIAAGSGVSYAKGLSFYIPAAMVGLPSLAWALMNMRKSRLVFLLYLGSIMASFTGFQMFQSLGGQLLAFAGFGMASALYTALCMNLWPTLYGRRFANRYLGMAASFDLCATAIGPVFFGFLLDNMSIVQALRLCLYLPLVVGVLFIISCLREPSDRLKSGAVWVSYGAGLWDRLRLRHQLADAPLIPYRVRSLRLFPNHHFLTLLWQMIERVELGQPMTLHVVAPRASQGNVMIAVHDVLRAHGDRFAAFHAIRDQVRAIFHGEGGHEEAPFSFFHAVPKAAVRHEILNSPQVQKHIQESQDPKAGELAVKYFDEIVCDRRHIHTKLLSGGLRFLFRRIFFKMEMGGAERIKELDRHYQVVYLPSHRSHIDFIATSQLLYLNGIEPPYIAASNHLNFFPVKLFQYVSSYFIRRKKMDAIYNAVLYEYMKVLQRYGKSQMVFVEGTRSKIGEVLQPKAGIVSQYINAYVEERARPVVFLPLNITYDFILEGDSYLQHIIEFRESVNELDDEHKKAFARHVSEASERSLWNRLRGFVGFLWNLKPRGNVYLTPGEPIFLDDVLKNHCPDWRTRPIMREEAIPDAWIRDIARRVARSACVEINRVSPLTPSSLVATALLASQGRALSEGELRAYVSTTSELWNRAYDIEVKHEVASLDATLAAIPFLNQCRRRGERRSPDAPAEVRNLRRGDRRKMQKVFLAPLDSLRSTYNRNVVIHSFVIPHLLANFLVERNMVLREDMREYFFSQYEPLKNRYHLPWETEGAWRKLEHFLELFEEKGLLSQGPEAILLNQREDMLTILGIYARALKSIA